MHEVTAHIEFMTPYCQSRFHNTEKQPKELSDAYENRTWKERLHTDEDGIIQIPAMAFANAIKETAKFLSIQIPGKGKATWTKHFEAGISVLEDVPTGVSKDSGQVIRKQLFVPSDGKRGSGSRVMKSYPWVLPPLQVSPVFYISDDVITPEVFAAHLVQTGFLIGLGTFRVRNNGTCGRFEVNSIDWKNGADANLLPPINIVKEKGLKVA